LFPYTTLFRSPVVSDSSGGVGLVCGIKRGILRMAIAAWGFTSESRRAQSPTGGFWSGSAMHLDRQFSKTRTGRHRRSTAYLLHRSHQRKRQKRGPQERQAILGAGLRVGADARRVVGRSGNESRSYRSKILTPFGPRFRR